MKLAELELKLPNGNGFHDAYITSIEIDYPTSEMRLGMKLLLGGPDNPVDPMYRAAFIKISDVKSLVIETPGLLCAEALQVSNSGPDWNDVIDPKVITAVNGAAPFYSFFISNWNSCIHIAATNATHEWSDGKQ